MTLVSVIHRVGYFLNICQSIPLVEASCGDLNSWLPLDEALLMLLSGWVSL